MVYAVVVAAAGAAAVVVLHEVLVSFESEDQFCLASRGETWASHCSCLSLRYWLCPFACCCVDQSAACYPVTDAAVDYHLRGCLG